MRIITNPTRVRLSLRLTTIQKALIEQAAALQGRPISEFVIEEAVEAARQIFRAHTMMALRADESQRFVEVLLNPPTPNEHLRAAAARYRTHTGE